jgi:hypothetical protein
MGAGRSCIKFVISVSEFDRPGKRSVPVTSSPLLKKNLREWIVSIVF